jgi:hypothetical protein
MRRYLFAAATASCFVSGIGSRTARAQPTAHAPPAGEGRHGRAGLELWAGYSASAPDLGFLGRTTGRRLALAGGRVSRALVGGRAVVVDYTADLVPLALLWQPTPRRRATPPPPPCVTTYCTLGGAAGGGRFADGAAYGAGLSPVGLTATFRPQRAVQLRVGGTGGMLWFDRVVPTERATRLNFTATAEAGVQVVGRSGRGLSAVYRFHHLSNAGLGAENYGLASHVVSLGTRWRLGRR